MSVDPLVGPSDIHQHLSFSCGVTELQGLPSDVEMLPEMSTPIGPKQVNDEMLPSESQLPCVIQACFSLDQDSPIDATLPKYILSLPAPGTAQARLVGSPEKSDSFVSRSTMPPSQRVKVKFFT